MNVKKERERILNAAEPFCKQKGLSYTKLKEQVFSVGFDCALFGQPTDAEPNGLLKDVDSLPLLTLIAHLNKNGDISFEETEHTLKYLLP
jgi:hypothetical protein